MAGETEAFERECADFHGRKHGIMTNSGSSANLVAVAALFNTSKGPLRRHDDSFRGQRALAPAVAWSTTYSPLHLFGLKIVLSDVDATWNAQAPDGDALPRLLVLCPILGNPGYGAEWLNAAVRAGSYLLEDACESFGAVYSDGKLCGTKGHLSTLSFFYSHQISGIEGGMILTDDDELADWCRVIRAHGWTRDIRRPERFEDEYDFVTLDAFNVRPVEMHAAIAREQLKKAEAFQRARIENLMRFVTQIAGLPIKMQVSNGVQNPFGIAFTCERVADRADLVAALRANRIDCRLPTGGSYRLHKYGRACAGQSTPVADFVHRHGLFLGNAPYDIGEKIDKAVKVIRAVFDAKARAA